MWVSICFRPLCSLSSLKADFLTKSHGNATGQDLVEIKIAQGTKLEKTDIKQRLGYISRLTMMRMAGNIQVQEKKS